jgi:hypothetical protein
MRKRLWTCWDDEEVTPMPTIQVFELDGPSPPLLVNARGEPIQHVKPRIGFAMPSKR